jgi:rhodanese-related sulfurtransferase
MKTMIPARTCASESAGLWKSGAVASGSVTHYNSLQLEPVKGRKTVTMPEFKQLVDEIKKDVKEIDLADLKKMQAEGACVIDVREREDSDKGTIPGATAIPRGALELNIDQVTTDKEQPIVLYCGGGSRSALAAYMLQKMGFRKVYSLSCGYRGWKDTQGK